MAQIEVTVTVTQGDTTYTKTIEDPAVLGGNPRFVAKATGQVLDAAKQVVVRDLERLFGMAPD